MYGGYIFFFLIYLRTYQVVDTHASVLSVSLSLWNLWPSSGLAYSQFGALGKILAGAPW